MKKVELTKYISFITAALLFGALMRGLPYNYFQILRWVVTLAALFLSWEAIEQKSYWKVVILIGLAVLFNPIEQVRLPRATWRIINIAAGLAFIAFGVMNTRRKDITLQGAKPKPELIKKSKCTFFIVF